MRLVLGCGNKRYSNSVNLDSEKVVHPNIVANINEKFPFKDNTFSEIICEQILEHTENIFFTMDEIHRVAKPNAVIKITVPYFSSELSYVNPQHGKHFFGWNTFDFWTPNYPQNYITKSRFLIVKKRFIWISMFEESKIFRVLNNFVNFILTLTSLSPYIYQKFFCWILPVDNIYFEMVVLK